MLVGMRKGGGRDSLATCRPCRATAGLVADFGSAFGATSAGRHLLLGAMIYEMPLGEPPFTGPTAQWWPR